MRDLIVDSAYLTQTLSDLIAINSINASLVPDGPGEAEIGAYLAKAMGALGLEVNVDEVAPGRVNVIGRRAGRGSGRSLDVERSYGYRGAKRHGAAFHPHDPRWQALTGEVARI